MCWTPWVVRKRSLAISVAYLRRPVAVTLGPDQCKCLKAAVAALSLVTSASAPGGKTASKTALTRNTFPEADSATMVASPPAKTFSGPKEML